MHKNLTAQEAKRRERQSERDREEERRRRRAGIRTWQDTRFLRKSQVAARYGIDERTVDRWKLDGRLPPPQYRGRIPLWPELELDASDKAAAAAYRDQPTAA